MMTMMTCAVTGNEGTAPLVRIGLHEWRSEVTIHGPGIYTGGVVWCEPGVPLLFTLSEPVYFCAPGVLTIVFREGDEALSVELRQALLHLAA